MAETGIDAPTGVYGGYCTLHNDRWETVKASEGAHDLLQRGEFCDHVKEKCDKPDRQFSNRIAQMQQAKARTSRNSDRAQ